LDSIAPRSGLPTAAYDEGTGRTMRLLIPSAGKRYLHLKYFKECAGVENVITTEINSMAPGIHAADRCYQMPRSNTPEYVPALLELCRRERIDAIIPLMDLDIAHVNTHRRSFETQGVKLLLPPSATVELSMDKLSTYTVLSAQGLPFARTFLMSDWVAAREELGFPMIYKPRHAGMKSSKRYIIGFLHNPKELDEAVESVGLDPADYVLQKLFQSTEIQVEMFCDADGTCVAVVPYERLGALTKAFSRDGGSIDQGVTFRSDEFTALSKALAAAIECYGPLMYQGYWDEAKRFEITELNPRLAGGSPLARAAGADVFQWSIDLLRGVAFDPCFDLKTVTMTSWVHPIFFETAPAIDKTFAACVAADGKHT
jgi:carbamoyl-phosphate synthase large subunit